jgi:hypothetical protein
MYAKKSEQEQFDIDHLGEKFVQKRKEMQTIESNLQENATLQDRFDFLKYKCSILTEEIKRWRKECQLLNSTILDYNFDSPNMWFGGD